MIKHKRTWYSPRFRGTEDPEVLQDIVGFLLACVGAKKDSRGNDCLLTHAPIDMKGFAQAHYITSNRKGGIV